MRKAGFLLALFALVVSIAYGIFIDFAVVDGIHCGCIELAIAGMIMVDIAENKEKEEDDYEE